MTEDMDMTAKAPSSPWTWFEEDNERAALYNYYDTRVLERTWLDKGDEESAIAYSDRLYQTGDVLSGVGVKEEALKLYALTISVCNTQLEKGKSFHLMTTLYIAQDRIGDIHTDYSVWNGSYESYSGVYSTIKETIKAFPGENEPVADLAIVVDKLGFVCEMTEKWNRALLWYQEGVKIREEIVRRDRSEENMTMLSMAEKSMAHVMSVLGDWKESLKTLEIALEHARIATEDMNNPQDRQLMISILDKMSTVRFESGIDMKDSVKWWKEALENIETLRLDPEFEGEEDLLRIRAKISSKIAEVDMELEQYEEAETFLNESCDIAQSNIEKYKNDEDKLDLAHAYDKRGDLEGLRQNIEGSLEWYQKAEQERRKMKKDQDTPQKRESLFFILKKISIILRSKGRTKEALSYSEKALKLSKKMVKEGDENVTDRYIADTLSDIGELYEDEEKYQDARDWYLKALRLNKRLAKDDKSVENLSELADNYDGLGFVEINLKDLVSAEKRFKECLKLNTKLLDMTKETQEKRALASTLRQLGLIATTNSDYEKGKDFLSRAVNLQKEVMHESTDDEDRLVYSDMYAERDSVPSPTISLPL